MKRFLAILVGGVLVFNLLAVAQEWPLFAAAWFGTAAPSISLAEADRKAAADTVHEFVSLLAHVHAAGGDARFLDRLPASDEVVAEVVEDVRYLARNRRRQSMSLERMDVTAVESVDERSVLVRTREWWTVGTRWAATGVPAEKARPNIVDGRFLVVRTGSGWRVESADAQQPASRAAGARP